MGEGEGEISGAHLLEGERVFLGRIGSINQLGGWAAAGSRVAARSISPTRLIALISSDSSYSGPRTH